MTACSNLASLFISATTTQYRLTGRKIPRNISAARPVLAYEMTRKNRNTDERNIDKIDRRGFLDCMAWAGTGLLYAFSGGVAQPGTLDAPNRTAPSAFSFVQISDSHIGFKKEANNHAIVTLQAPIVNA